MTRPLRKTEQPSLLLSFEELLHLLGFSARKWYDLQAAEHLARQQGKHVEHPLPLPVALAGRRLWRRKDIVAWVESLDLAA